MPGLKLVMAVSYDGFLAKGPDDDMDWTSPYDKAVFKLLTMGQTVGAGATTAAMLPVLPGREVVSLSRSGHRLNAEPAETVHEFQRANPGAWLIGGPTVARIALEDDLLDWVYMCHSQACLFDGMPDRLSPYLEESPMWSRLPIVQVGDVKVSVWRRA